jgi:hypothetical protein
MKTFVYHIKRGTSTSRPAARRCAAIIEAVPLAEVRTQPESARSVDNGAMQRAMHHARSRSAKRRA